MFSELGGLSGWTMETEWQNGRGGKIVPPPLSFVPPTPRIFSIRVGRTAAIFPDERCVQTRDYSIRYHSVYIYTHTPHPTLCTAFDLRPAPTLLSPQNKSQTYTHRSSEYASQRLHPLRGHRKRPSTQLAHLGRRAPVRGSGASSEWPRWFGGLRFTSRSCKGG